MGNWLATLAIKYFQFLVEQIQKTEAEKNARELLIHEIPFHYSYESYQEIIEYEPWTGFMCYYVYVTAEFETMTTTAKRDVVLSLAKSDLLRDLTFIRVFYIQFST